MEFAIPYEALAIAKQIAGPLSRTRAGIIHRDLSLRMEGAAYAREGVTRPAKANR